MKVLADKRTSELGRFAISRQFDDLGAFKTPTLRNVAVTPPYMHDGSLKTLRDVVVHYNNGGVTKEGNPVNDFLSGGIRPLNLTDAEIDDLVSVHGGAHEPRVRQPSQRSPHGGEAMTTMVPSRRDFLKGAATVAAAGIAPVSVVKLAFADPAQNFTFAYISDAHIQHISGTKFVRNWDRGLIRAVAETNLLTPKPDFVIFGGDLAQLGTKEELDHGAEMLSKLRYKTYHVMGEHDYYLDLGAYWSKLFGPHYYSFDHKGVHFVVLNSILTFDDWTYNRWPSAAAADARDGRPRQPERLAVHGGREAARVAEEGPREGRQGDAPSSSSRTRPSRSSTRDGTSGRRTPSRCRRCCSPSTRSTVVYGHVHQIQYNQIGKIAFNAVMATAWPWPYPQSYAQAQHAMPTLTVPMNRADPFFERDATGWQFIDMKTGRVAMEYNLYNNSTRTVAWNPATGKPEDRAFQDPAKRIPPQIHY